MYKKLILLFLFTNIINVALAGDVSEIKQKMIKQSIENYRGNCPCPYNLAKNGSRCGKRSAYSREGGASPLCYEYDITDLQALEWSKKKPFN